jgi:hypothetical protein
LVAIFAGRFPVQAAVVYKWTDADGVVHFSDQSAPGAERILTSTGATPGGAVPAPSSSAPPAKPTPQASAVAFTQFAIVSPANEETITGNQPVNVHLAVDPQLKPTQAITWYLNGNALSNQAADATQFSLPDLPRGTYTIAATVVDQASGETKSAETVTFYVARPSLLSPQHKTPP